MFNSFVLTLALRYFSAKKSNKLVSFISGFSLIGVMLGVAALIVVMAVMEGFHIEFTSNMIGLGGDVSITSYVSDRIKNYKKITGDIEGLEGVVSVVPQVESKALAISGADSIGVLVKGLSSEGLASKKQIIQNQLAGDISEIYNGYSVALGKELAIALKLRIGDDLTIICPSTVATMLGNLPRKKTFKVVNVFSSGMYDYDSAILIMSIDSAQKLFSYEDSVNLIEVYTNDTNKSADFADQINIKIGDEYNVSTWEDTNYQFLNALKIERVAMFTILSLIIIVAAFNIISSLFMLVNEKRKDIAILKTMGATKLQILNIFVINGSLIGFIGTGLGVILGVGFANNIESIRQLLQSISGTKIFEPAIYFLYNLPSKIVPENVIFICVMSITLSIVATIYPAYKASTLDPAEAIRNE